MQCKGVLSFLSYFKTLSNCVTQGIEPSTSRSAVKRSYRPELIVNPAAVKGVLLWCLRFYLGSVHSLISSTGAFVSFC